jgi:antitoxin (DNA-binding transcriptional repressor) of toxin-antitoxin stability system
MISVSVREMKAHWKAIEKRLRQGETITVLNRGKPAAKIVPPDPGKVLAWPDHLATAIPNRGQSGAATVAADRGDR